ncbi:MAG: NADH-quinone oxidoreductase subunit C [Armatimonadetes bacterium]|nr:NADH-quinone oxidoreductase subunit C [Armatimonadota bacterium]
MNVQQLGESIQDRFGPDVIDWNVLGSDQLYVTITPESLVAVAEYLCQNEGCRYVINSGTDRREHHDAFLITHFFAQDEEKIYIAIHTEVGGDDPQVDSITPVVPAANWSERETRDMVGVVPVGHPDPRRLVLADDWPEDLFPLRYDVEHGVKPPPVEGLAPERLDPPEGASVVPIGPYFPVLEEPAYFRVFVEGETVVGADYRGFYNHRGIEKLGCSVLTYNQVPFIAERICGICGFVHSSAYCQAAERAAGVEVPERGEYIRTIMLELERLESHMLWLGIAGHIIGFDTILMQTWRMREPLMWLCERISGNRKTYGMNLVGGVRRDIKPEIYGDIRGVIEKIDQEWAELAEAIPGDTTLITRLQGTGILTPEVAHALGAAGPTARGSGLAIDVRVDHPYAAYDRLEVTKCVHDTCDNLARVLVRVEETLDAIKIIHQALDDMPDGPIMAEIDDELPAGRQAMSAVEAPRGEVFHWVLTGTENRPERWRVRAPTYANLQCVPPMLEDNALADVPICIGSFDPCFSCTERMEVVDVNSGQVRVYTEEEFRDEYDQPGNE